MNYAAFFTAPPNKLIPIFRPHTDEWIDYTVPDSGVVIFYIGTTKQKLTDRHKNHKFHFYQTYEWLNGGIEHLKPTGLSPLSLFFAIQRPWNFALFPLEGDVEAEQIQYHLAEGCPLVNTEGTGLNGLKRGNYKSKYSPVTLKYEELARQNWEKNGKKIFARDTTQRVKVEIPTYL